MRWVLLRDPAGKFAPQAFLATKLALDPMQILPWFIQRWPLATTFEEARAHLGRETSRPWNERSVSRTTPAVLGLDASITLSAAQLIGDQPAPVRPTAWYPTHQATFSDAIALVRRSLWRADHVSTAGALPAVGQIPPSLFERFPDALCYAA